MLREPNPIRNRASDILTTRLLLGEALLDGQIITQQQLDEALVVQRKTGAPLGQVLQVLGSSNPEPIARALARQYDLRYVNSLEECNPDPGLARAIGAAVCAAGRMLPLRKDRNGVLVATDDPRRLADIVHLMKVPADEITIVLTHSLELLRLRSRVFRDRDIAEVTRGLLYRRPEESASITLTQVQKVTALVLALLLAGCLLMSPVPTLLVLNMAMTVFYIVVSGYKLFLVARSLSELPDRRKARDIEQLDSRDLPTYTILVPLYQEWEVLPTLVRALQRMDYPQVKLDIKLLVEEDDTETIQAINELHLPAQFRMVVVPDCQPRTKPKACNYGLLFAEGDYTVIYDAEDLPDPDQLKKAVLAFRNHPAEVVCMQARLNYYNRDQNLLTRWFTSEYSLWFDLLLPALDATHAPIPLGGTSNHFATAALRELGAWDPYNVTEDADLGIRLHKAGYRTAVIDSTTYEEANSELYNWVRQRSRWVKGYMQTWAVHMRNPIQLLRSLGPQGFFSFQFIVGGTCLIFLLNPLYWLLTLLWIMTQWQLIPLLFPGPIYYLGMAALLIGNYSFIYINVAGALRRGYYGLVRYALLSPLYWMLMSLAAWRALFQLLYNPSYWEKTVHGLSKLPTPAPEPESISQEKE